jgi:hypothetical protein
MVMEINSYFLLTFIGILISFLLTRIAFYHFFNKWGLAVNPEKSKQFINIISAVEFCLKNNDELTIIKQRILKFIRFWEIINWLSLPFYFIVCMIVILYLAENHPSRNPTNKVNLRGLNESSMSYFPTESPQGLYEPCYPFLFLKTS